MRRKPPQSSPNSPSATGSRKLKVARKAANSRRSMVSLRSSVGWLRWLPLDRLPPAATIVTDILAGVAFRHRFFTRILSDSRALLRGQLVEMPGFDVFCRFQTLLGACFGQRLRSESNRRITVLQSFSFALPRSSDQPNTAITAWLLS